MIFRKTISSQMSPSEFDLLTIKIINEENHNDVKNNDVNTNDVNTNDITKSKKKSKKDTKKEHVEKNTNTLTFVGKHEKNTFLGFLECMNMHKKKVIKNVLGDLEVIPEDAIRTAPVAPSDASFATVGTSSVLLAASPIAAPIPSPIGTAKGAAATNAII